MVFTYLGFGIWDWMILWAASIVDEFFEKHYEVLEVYTVSYSSWSQFLMMVATIFATYKNGLRHLAVTTFATTLLSFFGLRHGTLIILSILI